MRKITDRIFGGISMTWPKVFLFAVITAVLTALFLIVPVLADSSLGRMGVYLDAWILFAVIIMSNCKKPLESAVKVFVFFLVSQPLIYLFQVPFSWQGWGIFHYYGYWFIWTLLTFPGAFIGWYITRKDWLSALIFMPVIGYLALTAYSIARQVLDGTSSHIFAVLFCVGQIFIYVFTFFPRIKDLNGKARIAAKASVGASIALPLLIAGFLGLRSNELVLITARTLPGIESLSAEATVHVEDESVAEITISIPEDAIAAFNVHKYGSTIFTVYDGNRMYAFLLNVEDGGKEVILEILPSDTFESG